MSVITQLKKDQEFLEVFHNFVQTYQQLAALKMQKIRNSIIQTRRYIDGLADVFIDIETSHQKALAELTSKDESGSKTRITLSSIAKNGRRAAIFISPDTKFSGRITRQVFQSFRTYITQHPEVDPIIIGRVGAAMFSASEPDKKYQFFRIPQSLNEYADLKQVIMGTIEYEIVDVFYARFYSLVNQGPVNTNLTGNISISHREENVRTKHQFIFEPPLQTLLKFFEVQIFSSLVQQSVNESYLATLGSRITTLESATQSAKDRQTKLASSYHRLTRNLNNKQQINHLAGLSLW